VTIKLTIFASSVWSADFLVKPLVGARPVRPGEEPHAHTLNINPCLSTPHSRCFKVILRSRGAQLRTESEWEEEEDKKKDR
jgi:hypothetical protein